jgi:hypothetical protein
MKMNTKQIFINKLNLKTMQKPVYSSTYVKSDTISVYIGQPKKRILIAPNEWYKPSEEYMEFKNKMKLNNPVKARQEKFYRTNRIAQVVGNVLDEIICTSDKFVK